MVEGLARHREDLGWIARSVRHDDHGGGPHGLDVELDASQLVVPNVKAHMIPAGHDETAIGHPKVAIAGGQDELDALTGIEQMDDGPVGTDGIFLHRGCHCVAFALTVGLPMGWLA